MSSLSEERKLPKKGMKDYSKRRRSQQLQSTIKNQKKSVYVKGAQKC